MSDCGGVDAGVARLAFGVFLQGVRDATSASASLVKDARAWINDAREGFGSFEWTCGLLSFEPASLRLGLNRMIDEDPAALRGWLASVTSTLGNYKCDYSNRQAPIRS